MIPFLSYKNLILFSLFFFTIQTIFSQEQFSIEKSDQQAQEFLDSGNKPEAARLYTQSAYYYRNKGELGKAILYYLKVLELNKELNNTVGQMLTHSNLSMLYIESEQYDKALIHLKEELQFREKKKTQSEILPVLLTICSVQVELNDFENASKTANRSIDIAKELNQLPLLKRAYGVAFDTYSKWNKQEEAQQYFELYSAIDRKIKDDMVSSAQQEASQANTEKARAENKLQETNEELTKTVVTLKETERIRHQQELELNLQQALINEQNALLHLERLKKRMWAYSFMFLTLFVIVLSFLLIKLRLAKTKIETQSHRLELQNKEIKSSIDYAQTIQSALLSDLSDLDAFGEHFLLYLPKDIVSGDFYWCHKVSDSRLYFTVVDCTGHGVPGAFMSMIGMRMLNEIILELEITSPAEILKKLNELIRIALRQEQTDNKDGMDLALICIDKQENSSYTVTYAGAKRPLYYINKEKGELEQLKPTRKSIGGYLEQRKTHDFSDQTIQLVSGDELFMFSDGIADQNNPNRKKFSRARLEHIMKKCIGMELTEQLQLLEYLLNDFMQNEEQRDDITFTGLRLK